MFINKQLINTYLTTLLLHKLPVFIDVASEQFVIHNCLYVYFSRYNICTSLMIYLGSGHLSSDERQLYPKK